MITASSGAGVLRGNRRFDLEAGIEATGMGRADVWWRQAAGGRRELMPLLGARVCALGAVAYEPLGYQQLAALTYHDEGIPGGPQGTNTLVPGSVVAVRTRSGKLVKVQVQSYGQDLHLRWQGCPPPTRFTTLKVVVGSAPEWLVSRYVVDCVYESPDSSMHPCGTGAFGAGGGVVEDRISDEWGGFPAAARVTVSVDFQPGTGLHGAVTRLEPEVGPSGVSLLYEPEQEIKKIKLVFDLTPRAKSQDYLLLRWLYRSGSSAGSGSQRTLTGADLRENVAQHELAFPPDGSSTAAVDLTVDGVYQGAELVQFKQRVSLPASALAFRFRKQGAGPRYRLEAF
ncbi:hypothetical protein ABGB09_28875 [Streptomyces sp. B8F3]|uniref:hypothetical protein n=1 Tax=Streptomyces sp. B8F3 TaxID=3153573 RepID=UPI00325DF908